MERPLKKLPNILIGTPVKNCREYLRNYARQVAGLDYPKEKITIVIVENDSEDKSWDFLLDEILPYFKKYPYRGVYFQKRDLGFKLSHFSRHLKEFKIKRQESIDRTRQYILDTFLTDHEYVLWFDADLDQVPPQALNVCLSYSTDVVVPLFKIKTSEIYDASTYSGGRYIGKLIIEDRQKDHWKIERTNCHFLIHRRVFDRGYIYWREDIPRADLDFMKYRRFRIKNSVYTFENKNINAIFTKRVVILHAAVTGMKKI